MYYCPLCHSEKTSLYYRDKRREYFSCANCRLVFVPESYHPAAVEEKRIYDLHENDVNDPGYRRFLSRLYKPLINRVATHAEGLDFGCGPGPALAAMLTESGRTMSLYDLYYHKEEEALQKTYDFVCATEVVEHLKHPGKEFQKLFGLLKSGGWLALMTKLVRDREAFARWHYIQDQTHISFFSRETFLYLSEQYNCEVDFVGNDVIFLRKR